MITTGCPTACPRLEIQDEPCQGFRKCYYLLDSIPHGAYVSVLLASSARIATSTCWCAVDATLHSCDGCSQPSSNNNTDSSVVWQSYGNLKEILLPSCYCTITDVGQDIVRCCHTCVLNTDLRATSMTGCNVPALAFHNRYLVYNYCCCRPPVADDNHPVRQPCEPIHPHTSNRHAMHNRHTRHNNIKSVHWLEVQSQCNCSRCVHRSSKC